MATNQIALATSAALTGLGFLFHRTPLYPPPSYLAFILTAAALIASSTFAAFRLLEACLSYDLTLVDYSALALPRNLALLLLARLANSNDPGSTAPRHALTIASFLLAWAHHSPDPDEEEGFLSELRTRRASSLPFLMSSHPSTPAMTPLRSHSPIPEAGAAAHSPSLQVKEMPALDELPMPRQVHSMRSQTLPALALLPWLGLLLSAVAGVGIPSLARGTMPMYLSNRVGLHDFSARPFAPKTLDIVFAYHDEDLDEFAGLVHKITSLGAFSRMERKVFVYAKGDVPEAKLSAIEGVDEVHALENVGREGETYLTHILRQWESPAGVVQNVNHDPTATSHADFTLFLQHHLAWHWVAEPRFDFFDAGRTGFLSLG